MKGYYYSSILKISRNRMELSEKNRILSCIHCTGIIKRGIFAYFFFLDNAVLLYGFFFSCYLPLEVFCKGWDCEQIACK